MPVGTSGVLSTQAEARYRRALSAMPTARLRAMHAGLIAALAGRPSPVDAIIEPRLSAKDRELALAILKRFTINELKNRGETAQ